MSASHGFSANMQYGGNSVKNLTLHWNLRACLRFSRCLREFIGNKKSECKNGDGGFMKNHSLKNQTATFLAAFIGAGSLFAGTLSVPAPSGVNAEAETAASVCPIGYSVNILSDEFGATEYLAPVLDKTFTASDEINFVQMNKFSLDVFPGRSYDSYKALAESVTTRRKSASYLLEDGYFFLHDLKYTFGNLLSDRKYATQYFYSYSKYSLQYSLTLENGAYFSSAYSDKFDPEFLKALDGLSAGALTYPEFFDTFGTHVIIGADYGAKFEAYYGCFSENPLGADELQEIHQAVNASLQPVLENVATERWNPDGAIPEKYEMAASAVVSEYVASSENEDPVVIGYSQLSPLCDILPESYSLLAEPMEEAFREYAAANTNLYENSFLPDPAKTIETPQTPSVDNGNEKALKIALIGSVCAAVVFAGTTAVGFTLCLRKKKKQ